MYKELRKIKVLSKLNNKFVRYSLVGIIGTFIHLSILTVFVEVLHYEPVISSANGFIFTVVISYYLNYKWTFKAKSSHRFALPRYIAVSLMGLCLNTAILFFTVNLLQLWYGIGQAIAVVTIPLHNFILNSYWAFKE